MSQSAGKPVRFRLLVACLLSALLLLQVRLWISRDGFAEVSRLKSQVELQTHENDELADRNERLTAEVEDLQSGFGAVEERARSDLGLIGQGESFYLFSAEESLSQDESNRGDR